MRHRTLIATSVIAVAVVLLLGGCGGSSSGPSVAHSGGEDSPAAGSGSIGPGSADIMTQLLKYATCVREHGVPNFPDPTASDGFAVRVESSPAARAAQALCRKFLPGGGPPGPGAATHPSAQALAQMLRVSQCMRSHGIHAFPDPASHTPLNPPARGVVADMSGVILVFPSSQAMRSPAFAQAEAACKFGIRPPQ